MPQRYKLRLGDGTVLGVDFEALSTWAVDGDAMVQSATTGKWQPLRKFLIRERAAARRAAQASPGAASAAAAPTAGTPTALPLVYPKPRQAESKSLPLVRPPVEPHALFSPVEAPVVVDPVQPAMADPVEPAFLASPIEPSSVPDQPLSLADQAPFVTDQAPAPTDPVEPPAFGGPVEGLSLEEPEVVEADELPGWANDLPAWTSAAPEPFHASEAVAAVPAPPEPLETLVSLQTETPVDPPGVLSLAEVAESAVQAGPMEAEVLEPPLDERGQGIPELAWLENDDVAPALVPMPVATPLVAARDEAAESPAFFLERPDLVEYSRSQELAVQALADEPVFSAAKRTSSPSPADDSLLPRGPEPRIEELPVIPLKPIARPTPAGLGVYDEQQSLGVIPEARPRSELEEKLSDLVARAISAYDALLTGWIERLRQWMAPTSPAPDAPPPSLYRQASGLVDDLAVGVAPFVAQDRSSPLSLGLRPAPRARGSAAGETPSPPPPVTELPVLRFAHVAEEAEQGDVYEGDAHDGEGVLSSAWFWTKRLVLLSALVAGGLYAALNWQAWTPKAEELARAAFTEVDRLNQAQRQREALKEASEQLPYLDVRTIQQILATSATGVLDPPEIFRLAVEAADRGLPALSAEEAQELKTLRGELVGSLNPSERERIRDYDEARARRPVFPFEGRDIAQLYARGAEDVPAESLERLRELLGKAIAAGLVSDEPASPSTTRL